jgi:hypothetical protein
MVAVIFTWIGALVGIAVLLAMAFGAFVLDCHDALADRRVRHQTDMVPDPPAG